MIGGELDSLRLSSREGSGGLAKPQVSQADFLEYSQFADQACFSGKEFHGFMNRQIQDLRNVF